MANFWESCTLKLFDICQRPEKFLECDSELFNKTKDLTKEFYDNAKQVENGKYGKITLPELIIDNFDEEQVWTGVELQNRAVEEDLSLKIQKLIAAAHHRPQGFNIFNPLGKEDDNFTKEESKLEESDDEDDHLEDLMEGDSDSDEDDLVKERGEIPENGDYDEDGEEEEEEGQEEEDEEGEGEDEDIEEEDEEMKRILQDPVFQHMSDSEGDDLPLFDEKSSEDGEESEVDEEQERQKQDELEKQQILLDAKTENYMKNALSSMKETLKSGPRSEVEDRFFKLDEMERFLLAEESRERQGNVKNRKSGADDESEEDTSDIDLFDSSLALDSKADRIKHEDYFKDATDDEKMLSEDEANQTERNYKAGDLLADSDSEKEDLGEMKSSYEIRSAKLKKEIKNLEAVAISGDKPWQLVGEVSSTKRPENSLLQEYLEYDHIAKQAPIVTEEVTKRLEDIIIQRIKDKAWDDVERKIKPVENPYEYKKRLVLDQEKSKLSLAEVYEQEYLKQKGDVEAANRVPGILDKDDDGPPPEVDIIKKKMSTLFAKLDALTHFHYTPKAPNPDVKIVRNAPAISMEEVAPVAMNDENLLAPQELVDKKRGEMIGQTERTETERKRERRLKKLKQRSKEKDKQRKDKLLEKTNPGLGNKHSKKKVLKDIERAEKEGKLTTIKSKSKAVKSSSAFFSQLQDEAISSIKQKTKQPTKLGKVSSIAKLKL